MNVINISFTHLKIWGFHFVSYCFVVGSFFHVQGKDKVFFFFGSINSLNVSVFILYLFAPYILPLFGTGKIEHCLQMIFTFWHRTNHFMRWRIEGMGCFGHLIRHYINIFHEPTTILLGYGNE